jgi:CRP/FNR family cyclic AMP-dependent transcriptional regulator
VGRMTGTSRVTVTRVINRLRKRGQLLVRGQRFVIPDEAASGDAWPQTRAEASNTR